MKFAYKNHDNVINIPENFEVPVNVENVEGVGRKYNLYF
jgi:hypothetical protein